ncbi:hypothetical protein Tco_1185484 [Tanacetum coccineum]
MSARDKTGLGYGTQLNEMSNNSKTDSEISLSVFDVRSSDEESTPANDRFSKADGYHVVPPPITGNFLTSRADISFAGKINEANTQKPKTVYESVNRDKVIIEDWNLDDEDNVSEVQTVNPVKTNDQIGQTSKKAGIGFKKIKAFFIWLVNQMYGVMQKGVQNMTNAGTRAVIMTVKGNDGYDLKVKVGYGGLRDITWEWCSNRLWIFMLREAIQRNFVAGSCMWWIVLLSHDD